MTASALGLVLAAAMTAPAAGSSVRSLRTGLTGVLFTQRAMTSPEPPKAFSDFWLGAYEAVAR